MSSYEPRYTRTPIPDTLPNPYFTIEADAAATLTVKLCRIDDDRMAVEVWRDRTILCRVFGKAAMSRMQVWPRGLPTRVTEISRDGHKPVIGRLQTPNDEGWLPSAGV